MEWDRLDRMPRKGDRIRFDSAGMFPVCDGKTFTVLGKFRNYREILNIVEDGKDEHTQVIIEFSDGFNPYLHFIS